MARYSVKSRRYKKSNYSHENVGISFTFGETAVNTLYQGGADIVSAVVGQGTRTVGNWNITVPVNIGNAGGSTGAATNYWALVYVPQGTTINSLFSTVGSVNGSLYEPNQFVIASGISDDSAGPIRVRSSMKRKLHSGDKISLLIGSTSRTNNIASALVSYSIKYN